MYEVKHHEKLVDGIAEQMKPLLEKSQQGVYIYLDDTHKVCNQKFADMVGYESAKEWADTEAPLADVIEKDQAKTISAYQNATEKMTASCMDVTLKNIKTGKLVKTQMIMVPLPHKGHIFTLHFLSEV